MYTLINLKSRTGYHVSFDLQVERSPTYLVPDRKVVTTTELEQYRDLLKMTEPKILTDGQFVQLHPSKYIPVSISGGLNQIFFLKKLLFHKVLLKH